MSSWLSPRTHDGGDVIIGGVFMATKLLTPGTGLINFKRPKPTKQFFFLLFQFELNVYTRVSKLNLLFSGHSSGEARSNFSMLNKSSNPSDSESSVTVVINN